MAKTLLSRFRLPLSAVIVLLLLLLAQGCTQPGVRFEALAPDEAACLSWYRKLDTVLAEHELIDPSVAKIPGFPFLRTDRFLASFRHQPLSDAAYADWLERMRQLDESLRLSEAANLPQTAAKAVLAEAPLPGALEQVLRQCGSRLVKAALQRTETQPIIRRHARVPDTYRSWQRIAGAYWLMQYPVRMALDRQHKKLAASFKQPLEELPVQGRLIRYAPMPGGFLTAAEMAAMLRTAYQNPLGIPALADEKLERLFNQFAPVWEIDTRNDTDKIGKIYLTGQGEPRIDVRHPVVYRKQAYIRRQGRILLQLIYQIWLPAREKTGWTDLYGGDLDSLIWRVTLGPEGVPIAYDSIHACGCYYLLFPGPDHLSVAPKDGAEKILSPKRIDAVLPGQRLLLRLETRTHYLQQTAVIPETVHTPAAFYETRPYESLLSLPLPDGSRRSLFGRDGTIAASARPERYLFWPYGVPSPGAMRQWGMHAIAFTGRRHFDDPFLLENLIAAE
jgi:hypothetical protein